MPNATVKSYAKQSGKTVEEVEAIWEDCKKQAKHVSNEEDGKFWGFVNNCTKKKLGIKEDSKHFANW